MAIFRNFGTEALKQSDPMRIQEDEIKQQERRGERKIGNVKVQVGRKEKRVCKSE